MTWDELPVVIVTPLRNPNSKLGSPAHVGMNDAYLQETEAISL